MRVCWFGIYKGDYSRNQVLMTGLHEAGVEVIECNVKPREKFKYFKLIRKLISFKNEYDILFCAFPINYNVIFSKIFQSKPIIIDAFFPLYDAYIVDRKSSAKFSIKALVYYFLDKINLSLADLVITDTEQHKKYWLNLNSKVKVESVPVGAYTKEFFPINLQKNTDNFIVTFHGSYIPLQGIDKIVEAAEILKNNRNIKFRFIGNGQLFKSVYTMIESKALDIEIIPWLNARELNVKLNESDIILGIFGDTEKTDRVIPNKVFQGVAVKKPVITKDTVAIREIFNENEIYLITNSPIEIAKAIQNLYEDDNLRDKLSLNSYNKFISNLSEIKIGSNFYKSIKEVFKV